MFTGKYFTTKERSGISYWYRDINKCSKHGEKRFKSQVFMFLFVLPFHCLLYLYFQLLPFDKDKSEVTIAIWVGFDCQNISTSY